MLNLKGRTPVTIGCRPFLLCKIIIAVFLCCLGLGYWYFSKLVLILEPEEGKPPVVMETSIGDTWCISLTHSVERSPWEDFYRINGAGDMTMTHTQFSSLGWGYPYSPKDGKLEHKDGKYTLIMNRPYKKVAIRISEQAMPKILHGNKSYDLIKLYGDGTAVTISCEKRWVYFIRNFNF